MASSGISFKRRGSALPIGRKASLGSLDCMRRVKRCRQSKQTDRIVPRPIAMLLKKQVYYGGETTVVKATDSEPPDSCRAEEVIR